MAQTRDVDRLAQEVYLRRTRLGLSQAELAEAAKISTSTVRNIECGRVGERRGPSVPAIERVLGWTPGSGERVLAGGDPELIEQEEPVGYVSSRTRVPVDLSKVPLNELREELDRRIEDLVKQAVNDNPDARRT